MKKDRAAFTCCDATEMLCETIDGFEDRLIDSPNKSQLASWFRSPPQYDLRTVLYDGSTAYLEIRPRYEGFAFSFLEDPAEQRLPPRLGADLPPLPRLLRPIAGQG